MKKQIAVSLYYRLFSVFGLSFLAIIAVILFTNKQTPPHPSTELTFAQIWFSFAGLVLVGLILVVNSFLIHRILAPIGRVRQAAQEFGQGHLNQRLKIESTDEVGRLAHSFNLMADQIQSQLNSLRDMAVGVSHEIRSPLARMRLITEMIQDEKTRRLLVNEISNIDHIVEMTLERESLETGLSHLFIESISVKELLSELTAYYREAGESIELTLCEADVTLNADRRRLEMLLKNLLDNSFEHGGSKSPVRVELKTEGTGRGILIKDRGVGFDTQSITHGLGLRLCYSIAKTHGIELLIETGPKSGTEVRLRWN